MHRQMIAVLMAVVLLAAVLVGCSLRSSEAPLEDVDKAAGLFFQRLAEADYETIYKDTAKRFKEKKTHDEIVGSLKELGEYGKVLQHARISTGFEGEGKDLIVGAVYGTTFERRGGNLTLYFVDEGGEWRLIGFAMKVRG
ncbi:MAG: hypothetical protein AABO41_19415 [Acidobacteriota bacterium]